MFFCSHLGLHIPLCRPCVPHGQLQTVPRKQLVEQTDGLMRDSGHQDQVTFTWDAIGVEFSYTVVVILVTVVVIPVQNPSN